jgi:photosystem II stability/assembly factor-like uncharacterized protein
MKLRIAGCCIAMLLFFTTSAFAQWQFAYSQELQYSFEAIQFPTASVGYIVGSGGVIYKTIDGGSTWTPQTSPVSTTLNDVFFTDATHGFAVGASGTIIYTTDGTNWSVHAQSGVITTATIYSVWFVGSDGWIGGGADNATCQIYKTTDGGTNWANVTVTNPSTDMCTGLSFFDANLGYASLDGNGIMYTTDGGLNWTKSNLNLGPWPYTRTDIEEILAVDATHAVATGWGSMIGPQPTIIVVSSDSGVNFTCPDTSYPWATYGYGYNFTKFGNGEVMLVGGGASSAAFSIHSTDLATWTRYPAFVGEDINDACVVPGTDKVVAVGATGMIAVSTDRGTHWSFLYAPGTASQGINTFAAEGKDKIIAGGVNSAMISFDLLAGTATMGVISPENWGAEITDIKYVYNDAVPGGGGWGDAYNDVIYASGKNGYMCRSVDYGATWTELYHEVSNYEQKMKMHWFDPDTGIVVGCKAITATRRGETIWRTTDRGETLTEVWTPQINLATSMLWNSVSFAPGDPSVGVVVGDDNIVAYTTDRGYHWTQGTENIATGSLDLEEVSMASPLIAWAVGDAGTVVETTDGGANWTVVTGPWGTTQLMDVCFNTPDRGWICGDDGLVYYTTDGGSNWTSISANAELGTRDCNSIYYHGAAGILWIGADYGDVLNRSDSPATGTDTPSLPFALNQNYPNPFNPSTTIEFAIAKDDHVRLNVYSVSGKLVATIMNKNLKAGKYTVSFNADKLATGVYFYKLSTSTQEETRKMVLIR